MNLPDIRSVDLKQNGFMALEAPYYTGAGMSQNSSLYNFRASQNKLQASISLSLQPPIPGHVQAGGVDNIKQAERE